MSSGGLRGVTILICALRATAKDRLDGVSVTTGHAVRDNDDMIDRSTGCIYCGGGKPFTDEHVIPAGLGAGDEWQLEELVCERCNNDFSKFELRVMRSGAIGFTRQISQPTGRHRGSKT